MTHAHPPAAAFSGATYAFGTGADAHVVLRDIDLYVRAGAWTFVYGPPGAGKTTLLKLAAGTLAPSAGAVARAGAARLVLAEDGLDETARARDLVAASMPAPDDAAASALLRALGLDAYLDRTPFQLSRGHRKRLAIACALAAEPALLALDDPFGPLDRRARRMTADVLRAATARGLAIAMTSNDPVDGLMLADEIVLMTTGPAARIAAIHPNDPRPDRSPDDIVAQPLYEAIEETMWDEAS